MTKIFNFALKIKGVVGRVEHGSPPTLPPPQKNLERALTGLSLMCIVMIRQ